MTARRAVPLAAAFLVGVALGQTAPGWVAAGALLAVVAVLLLTPAPPRHGIRGGKAHPRGWDGR